MVKFVGFELLAANALIHEMESAGKRQITLSHAKEYAQKVTENLQQEGVSLVVMTDADGFQECEQDFIANYSDGVIVANSEVTSDDLRRRYRNALSYELLKACVDAEKDFDAADNAKSLEV